MRSALRGLVDLTAGTLTQTELGMVGVVLLCALTAAVMLVLLMSQA